MRNIEKKHKEEKIPTEENKEERVDVKRIPMNEYQLPQNVKRKLEKQKPPKRMFDFMEPKLDV